MELREFTLKASAGINERLSNINRKTQFTLGTDKIIHKSEAACNYKTPQMSPSPTPTPKDIKSHHFEFGSAPVSYETTASKSFESPKHSPIPKHSLTPSHNIRFGYDNPKKLSIIQSEFTAKDPVRTSAQEMSKIKALHRNCHFLMGSYQNDYKSSSGEYRGSSLTPISANKKECTGNIVFGNFKQRMVTEKQEKFEAKEGEKEGRPTSHSAMRKVNVWLGNERFTPIATSADVYRGTQLVQSISPRAYERKAGNVVFGSTTTRWESSYKQNFEEKEQPPYEKVDVLRKTNFQLGSWDEKPASLFQDSFNDKGYQVVSIDKEEKRKNHLWLGVFKRKFETANRSYGKDKGHPTKLRDSIIDGMKKVNISFGNDKVEFVSKFQKDFARPCIKPRDKLVNLNKETNIQFGVNKSSWESTYSGLYNK